MSSSVKATAFNPMHVIGDAVTKAFDSVADAVGTEVKRVVHEVADNIQKDARSISQSIRKGGLVGGVVEAWDTVSIGHQFANFLDSTNVIPESKVLQEGISAAVNLLSGNHLAGLKDIADTIGTLAVQNPGRHVQECSARITQTPMDPTTILTQRVGARCQSSAVTVGTTSGGTLWRDGYSDGSTRTSTYQDCMERWFGCDHANDGPTCSSSERQIAHEERAMLEQMKAILNNPCLTFEDMIFHLMRAVIKGTQAQAKVMAKALVAEGDATRSMRSQNADEVCAARQQLRDAAASGNGSAVAQAERDLVLLQTRHENALEKRAESRAERVEMLKNVLQKLSEMQQALSNILNVQHETAMATIRAIR